MTEVDRDPSTNENIWRPWRKQWEVLGWVIEGDGLAALKDGVPSGVLVSFDVFILHSHLYRCNPRVPTDHNRRSGLAEFHGMGN